MDINYELYKVFYQVALTLSFSEASKKLYISQSAVSQSIKTLEKKLGQTLFVRSTKRVSLTPAGAVLFKHIEPAMNLIARGESQLTDATILGGGQFHIGASDTICRYFLVPFFQEFHQKYPDVKIKVTNATSLGCVDLLEQGKVDMIIVNSPNSNLNPSYTVKTVATFSDVFIANPTTFPLLGQTLSFEELSRHPLMILDHTSATNEFLYRQFLNHQLELIPDIELSSNDLLLDMAKIGLGIAVVPDFCVPKESDELFTLSIEEAFPKRSLVAAVNSSLPVSAATEHFLKLLPEVQ